MSVFALENAITTLALFLSVLCFVISTQSSAAKNYEIPLSFSFFAIVTCIGYLGILQSAGIESFLVFATKIKYIGAFMQLVVLFMMISFVKIKLPKWVLPFCVILGLFVELMVLGINAKTPFAGSNPFSYLHFMSGWLFKSYYVQIRGGLYYLRTVNSWGYYFFTLLVVLYCICAFAIYLFAYRHKYVLQRSSLTLLFLSMLMPEFFALYERIYLIVTKNESIPVVPVGIIISNIIILYLIGLKKLYSLNTIAASQFYDYTDVPSMTLDEKFFITNVNRCAMEQFPMIRRDFVGKRALSVLPNFITDPFSDLLYSAKNVSFASKKSVSIDDRLSDDYLIFRNDKVYQPKVRTVNDAKGNLKGYNLTLSDITLLYNYKNTLEGDVLRKTEKIRSIRDQMVLSFAVLAEHHDSSSEGHLSRTSHYSSAIAMELMRSGAFEGIVNDDFVMTIGQVSPLHDIGKIYISSDILDKPGQLTDSERILMQTHTVMGAQFIETALRECDDELYSQMAYDIALCHHEWWNGTGYPNHKKGDDIPLCARIMAVSDVFDALTSKRSYKKAFSAEEAYDIIHFQSGTHFDPIVVKAFENIRSEIKAIQENISGAK